MTQKPIGKPVPAPTIKNRAPKIEKLDQTLKEHTEDRAHKIEKLDQAIKGHRNSR